MSVTHPFVSAKADGADTSLVRPSNWNAAHTIQDLPPDSDAARDLGSAVLRWRDLYASGTLRVGTTPATTGHVRLPNTGSVYGRNAGNSANLNLLTLSSGNVTQFGDASDSGAQVLSASLSVGGTPSTAGAFRMANSTFLGARNAANTGNIALIYLDGSNRIAFQPTSGLVLVEGTLTAGGNAIVALQIATSGPVIYSGSGVPTISAAVKGSLYLRTDGTTTTTRAYIATDAAGTWTALTTVA